MQQQRTQRRQEGYQGSYLHCTFCAFSAPLVVKNRTQFFCFLLIFSSITATFALSPNDDQNFITSYPYYLTQGFKNIVTERTNQWILSSAGLSALLLQTCDDDVRKYALDNGLLSEDLSRFLDNYGGGYAYPVGIAVVGMTSYLNGGKRQFISDMKYYLTAMGTTAFITDVLKRSVGRERPNGQGTRSFPSGHTSGSFVFASVMDELYGPRVGIPAYIIAGLVGIQRIHDNKHWLTDIIAGAALGMVIGRGFGKVYHDETNNKGVSIKTETGGDGIRLIILLPMKRH